MPNIWMISERAFEIGMMFGGHSFVSFSPFVLSLLTETGSPKLKASLLLTYDYLRLYVNAFAYQATISRALTSQRDNQNTSNRHMPLINATAPDARFIYEALDAAKSLLSTFNNSVDPETLRYMPSSYYLFIIYSAVFLYKVCVPDYL